MGGLIALGHQLLWTRRMVDVLGGSAESLSRVVGAFFLGLSLGAALSGLLVRRGRPFFFLALGEFGVLVGTLPIFLLPLAMPLLWGWLGVAAWETPQGALLKWLASFAAVFLPAFFMGWFLPLAARIIRQLGHSLEKGGLHLYAINTAGGVFGIAIVLFWLIPHAGTWNGLLLFTGLNGGLGLLFLALHFQWQKSQFRELNSPSGSIGEASASSMKKFHDAAPRKTRLLPDTSLLLLSFFSGWALLAVEVGMIEMLILVAPISYIAPGILLSLIIALLAIGAIAGSHLFTGPSVQRQKRLLVTLWATGIATLFAPFCFHWLAEIWGGFAPHTSYTGFLLRLTLLAGLACGPALFFAGLVFPWITATVGLNQARSKESQWAYLLAVNGMGGFIGAEMAYRLGMPILGLHAHIGAVGLFYLLAALGLVLFFTLRSPGVGWGMRSGLIGLLVSIGTALYFLKNHHVNLPLINTRIGWEAIEAQSGREGTIVTVEDQSGHRGILISNQYLLASTAARWRQERQGHIPLLLHPNPQRVAFLGTATGMTPAAATLHPEVNTIYGFEISKEVSRMAQLYFKPYTRGLFADPRFRQVIEDGRLGIAALPVYFDVIVADLFLPWGVGAGRLYSIEHFRQVRNSLRADGLFCQWLPMHQLSQDETLSIFHTFQSVFGEVILFIDGFESHAPSLALIGWRELTVNLDQNKLVERLSTLRHNGYITDPLMRWPEGMALLKLGEFELPPEFVLPPINTLNRPNVELSAAKGRLRKRPDQPLLTGVAWFEFVDKFFPLPKETAAPIEGVAGRQLLYLHANPHSDRRQDVNRQLGLHFPKTLLNDWESDWDQWPGNLQWVPFWAR